MADKSKLGLLSICLLGVNAIVGTGIFLLPGKAAKLVGVPSIGVILFDAVLVILIALCFAEAGGLFKKNGGPYVYAKEAFGEFVGFEVGFMKWAIMIIAWAAMAVGFPTALESVWPAAGEPFMRNIIAISLLLFLMIMNIAGVKISKIINNVITLGKLVPLVFFILLGIFFIKGDNFQPMQSVEPLSVTSFGAAALLIFYAFTGFESIAVAADSGSRHRHFGRWFNGKCGSRCRRFGTVFRPCSKGSRYDRYPYFHRRYQCRFFFPCTQKRRSPCR